jgi:hypothetical protein
MIIATPGVCDEGRRTTGQPAASAGASFRAGREAGKFQAVKAPTTPTACFLGVPAELVYREAPFAARLGNGLAGFYREHFGRFVGAADHLIGDLVHRVGARISAHLA